MIAAWEAAPSRAGDSEPWASFKGAVSRQQHAADMPHATPAQPFYDAAAGRGVGEDYENPFRTSAIWTNVQSPAAANVQQPSDVLLRAGRALPSGAMSPFDVTTMAALRAAAAAGGLPEHGGSSSRPSSMHSHADVNAEAGEAAPFGMSRPQGPWHIEDPLEATLGMLDAMKQVQVLQQQQVQDQPAMNLLPTALHAHTDNLPKGRSAESPRSFRQQAAAGGVAPGAAVGYHVRPMMHTLAPIHQAPPRVLQEIQDLLPPEQARFSPVYTRGGLRPPPTSNHDDTSLDREMTRHPKPQHEHNHHTTAAQSALDPSPPRPHTRPPALSSPLPHSPPPHILPPPSNSPRRRISPRPTKQYLPHVEDRAHTPVGSSQEPVWDHVSAVTGAGEAVQEATLIFPDDDYEWITSVPERQQRWLNHQKSTICRLLRVDGRRIQALTFTPILVEKLMRGSIRLVLRVLPISATPELAGKDTRSAKELKDSICLLTSDLFPPLSPSQEHVQTQPKTVSDKERLLEGRHSHGSTAVLPQAPASRLFQSILLHEQQEEVASEVSRRGGKTGTFHIPSPPNHDPADAALHRTDASSSASPCEPLDPVLGEWLRDLHLGFCRARMQQEGIDSAMVLLLSHEQLKELGLHRLGDRMKLQLRAKTHLQPPLPAQPPPQEEHMQQTEPSESLVASAASPRNDISSAPSVSPVAALQLDRWTEAPPQEEVLQLAAATTPQRQQLFPASHFERSVTAMRNRNVSRSPAPFHAEAFGESAESQGAPDVPRSPAQPLPIDIGQESPEISRGLAKMRKALASGHAVPLDMYAVPLVPSQSTTVKGFAPDDDDHDHLNMVVQGLRSMREEESPSPALSGKSLGHAQAPQTPVFVPQHADARSVIELSEEPASPDKKVPCTRVGERRNRKETKGCFGFGKQKAADSKDPGGLGLVFRTYKSKTKSDTKRHAVVEIYEGGAADLGGVCVGDVIMRIDGVSTDNLGTAEMSRQIKSASSLRLSRHGKLLDVSVRSAGGGHHPVGRAGSVRVEAETGFVAGGGGSKVVTRRGGQNERVSPISCRVTGSPDRARA